MKPFVFLVCTGVGHINRGYESFTIECFAHLRTADLFELYLLKGGGKSRNKELKISCIQRDSRFAKIIFSILKIDRYKLEQATFLVGMLPALIKYKPSVIYYSDFVLGTYLWHLRKYFKFKYKLLFSNGAPNGPPFKTEDHVQQLLPLYIEQAQNGGTSLYKQTLLPYAISCDMGVHFKCLLERDKLVEQLNLPKNKKIIITVGAVNSYHKRIDYIVEEFSHLKNEDYFLIVLGQIDQNSKVIIEKAKKTLLSKNFLIKQVNSSEVMAYLFVADYFVLASLNEGLPRVLLEALSAGLLPIVHDYQVTRETLGNYGVFRNMTQSRILSNSITEVDSRNISKQEIIYYTYQQYSWNMLGSRYERMITNQLK